MTRALILIVVLQGCFQNDCPDGFLRDNDGNCIQVEGDVVTDSDGDADTDVDADTDADSDVDTSSDLRWYDSSTGLTWQAKIIEIGITWYEADEYCEELVYAGRDDWRIPSVDELRTLVRGCPEMETGGDCPISNDCASWRDCNTDDCDGCENGEGPNDGCYWEDGFESDECDGSVLFSSTELTDSDGSVWAYQPGNARIPGVGMDSSFGNWGVVCVSG